MPVICTINGKIMNLKLLMDSPVWSLKALVTMEEFNNNYDQLVTLTDLIGPLENLMIQLKPKYNNFTKYQRI